jgi:hypothetical protein
MNREDNKKILLNLLCRLVFFGACFGACFVFAMLNGLVPNDALRLQYITMLMAFNFLFAGICVTLGAKRKLLEFWFFGFLMGTIPVIFVTNLRPIGIIFAITASIINGIAVAALYYYLTKLLSWFIVRMTAK